MFPISSLTPPAAASAVNNAGVNAVGTATDAPPARSVEVDLSPVANFLLSVSNAQGQLSGTQPTGAQRAETVNAAVQEVVDAFNLLPSVDFDQGAAQQASLLNNLVSSLNQNDGGNSQAQNLAQLGVTLQPPLLSDLTGGLSLEPEVLRAAVNANNEQTTSTLQNTLNTFRQIATDFAEQLSSAGSSQIPDLNPEQQPALTQADLVANARLDLARAALDNLAQNPLPTTAADRLAARRARLEQAYNAQQQPIPSPIVNQQLAQQGNQQVAQQNQAALNQQIQRGNFQQTQSALQAQNLQSARNAANAPTDPLRANPALAAAIAAYNINDVAGTTSRAAQAANGAIPAVGAVNGPTPTRNIGTTP